MSRHPAVFVWGMLVAATAASWWLGLHHGKSYTTVTAAATLILLITFIKVYLVGMYFMEIRHARNVLVRLFVAWTVVTCAATIGLYLFATLI